MENPRNSCYPSRKSSSSTLVFNLLIIFTFLVVILLALGILSVPSSSRGMLKAHDLSSIARTSLERSERNEENEETWVEGLEGSQPVDLQKHPSGIVLTILQNIVSNVNLDCKLDLKAIALQARNAEYNPKRFSTVIMRIKGAKAPALIFPR